MFDKELTPEQKARRAMLENRAWLHHNFENIQTEYMDKWIAVLDCKVVAGNENVEAVKSAVKERNSEAVIMRIPSDPVPTPI